MPTMATPRDVRRLAFQVLFQLDALGEHEAEALRAGLEAACEDDPCEFSDGEKSRAFELAHAAFRSRRDADAVTTELNPGWPAHRQPAVDRAILRLAYHEMNTGDISPKIVVNEAVELAKRYSTDKSPAFVNAILDKVLKRTLARREESAETTEPTA